MNYKSLFYLSIYLFCSIVSFSQVAADEKLPQRCGTMERLVTRLNRNPALKAQFEEQRTEFNSLMEEGGIALPDSRNKVAIVQSIPVVFHIVLTNPSVVSDAQLQAQLDTLNKAFSGTNGDTAKIPSYFKSLFGRSAIRFCLAQRTPQGESTTGIERITTSKTSFSVQDDGVKHSSTGGADSWDVNKYFNVWVSVISGNILGYATFPGDGDEAEQGVAIDYRSLPGGLFPNYNGGKSLIHETGHYFNLYHIWGDDNGACTGTDYVDDTPNQTNQTTGCYTGIRTDNCTPSGNGIMYQNYMDYSYDACMVMFTNQQIARSETALSLYRASLLNSDGCEPVVQRNYDAQLISIDQPAQRLCSASFTPVITIKNKGTQTLTSLTITTKIDDVIVTTSAWTGSLNRFATTAVTLSNITTSTGNHTLFITVSQPNNNTDEEQADNTLSVFYQYYTPAVSVSESFENSLFPPQGWDLVNRDKGITWQRVTGIAKTGNASVVIDNFENGVAGDNDELRLPDISISSAVDTAFLSFQIAAGNNNWDTLEVAVSTDCGISYTSLYKKWGNELGTRTTATAFIPTTNEWRKDSIDLSHYIGSGNLLIAFKNTSGQENNIYLDDINVYTVTVNPNLKAKGFLVSPNPTNGVVAVQFYPQPKNLKAIELYTISGQKLAAVNTSAGQSNYYRFDLGKYAVGTYIIRAVFTDKVVYKKIIRF